MAAVYLVAVQYVTYPEQLRKYTAAGGHHSVARSGDNCG